jgi:hypothetical protein
VGVAAAEERQQGLKKRVPGYERNLRFCLSEGSNPA